MTLVVAAVPHTREQLHVFAVVLRLLRAAYFFVFFILVIFYILHFAFIYHHVTRFVTLVISLEMWPIDQRCRTVLLPTEVIHQTHGIIHIVHVNSRIGIGADEGG